MVFKFYKKSFTVFWTVFHFLQRKVACFNKYKPRRPKYADILCYLKIQKYACTHRLNFLKISWFVKTYPIWNLDMRMHKNPYPTLFSSKPVNHSVSYLFFFFFFFFHFYNPSNSSQRSEFSPRYWTRRLKTCLQIWLPKSAPKSRFSYLGPQAAAFWNYARRS